MTTHERMARQDRIALFVLVTILVSIALLVPLHSQSPVIGQQNGPGAAVASMTADSAAINTTETSLVSYSVPASSIRIGTTYRFILVGSCTSTVANVSTLRVRFGSVGDNSDTAIGTLTVTAAASGTNVPFQVMGTVTFRTTASAEVHIILNNVANTGVSGTTNTVASITGPTAGLTTSTNQFLYFTYVSAAATTTSTFNIGSLELVKT